MPLGPSCRATEAGHEEGGEEAGIAKEEGKAMRVAWRSSWIWNQHLDRVKGKMIVMIYELISAKGARVKEMKSDRTQRVASPDDVYLTHTYLELVRLLRIDALSVKARRQTQSLTLENINTRMTGRYST